MFYNLNITAIYLIFQMIQNKNIINFEYYKNIKLIKCHILPKITINLKKTTKPLLWKKIYRLKKEDRDFNVNAIGLKKRKHYRMNYNK